MALGTPLVTAKEHSATESELKFTLSPEQATALIQYLDQNLQPQTSLQLSNAYFDTPDGMLNQHRIGCRIRRWGNEGEDQQAEQTVKLAGQTREGLHQRPEYNLTQGKQLTPNLTSFPAQIWPDKLDISAVNDALEEQFKVQFTRQRWHGDWPVGETASRLEVVLDQGYIEANGEREAVFEVEVELLEGALEDLLDLGKTLASRFGLQIFNESKAERGFALLARSRSS